jgi:hypothetical protein
MALAMMGGLVAATILTLTFLPALYAMAFRVAELTREDARSIDQPCTGRSERGALRAA